MKLSSTLCLLALLGTAQARSSGSPVCTANGPAPPQGPHGASSGSLATGNVAVVVDGQELGTGNGAALVVGEPVTVTISSDTSWLGILVRVPGATIDLPTNGLYREGPCPAGVGSLTHNSGASKQTVSFTLTMDTPGSNIGLDINIVRSFGTHYYSQFSLDAIAALPDTEAPTAAPVPLPTFEPTLEPTTRPTADPTSDPTLQPSTQTTVQPTVAPTNTTVSATESPSSAPTGSKKPSYAPSESPTQEPSESAPPSQVIMPTTLAPTLMPIDSSMGNQTVMTNMPTSAPTNDTSTVTTPTTTNVPTAGPGATTPEVETLENESNNDRTAGSSAFAYRSAFSSTALAGLLTMLLFM